MTAALCGLRLLLCHHVALRSGVVLCEQILLGYPVGDELIIVLIGGDYNAPKDWNTAAFWV